MQRRWPRLTIPVKVFLLAALNLGLLGALFLVFLRVSYHVDFDSFLLAPAQDRVVSMMRRLTLELRETGRSSWSELLERRGRSYGLRFWLVDDRGSVLAGQAGQLPKELRGEAREQAEAETRVKPHRRPPGDDEHHRKRMPGRIDDEHPKVFSRHTENPDRRWFAVRIPLPADQEGMLLAETISRRLLFDPTPWLLVAAAVILISVACWLPFVRGLTRSISRVTGASERIAEGRFDVQLPERRRDELGRLSASINRMAERLSRFIHGQKRFLGDTAHELCSPLARMQLALGILERSATPEQQRPIADLREDVQHMSALVNEVLMFSKAALKQKEVELEPVGIAETVRRVLEREVGDGLKIATSVDEKIEALAQPELLRRALSNVLRNAIRYAGAAGLIEISAEREGGMVVIRVSDCGPGVPEDQLDAMFDPFYRLEASRERETGGVGLGLAIVKTCIEACEGTVRARNRKPTGLEVEIRLRPA